MGDSPFPYFADVFRKLGGEPVAEWALVCALGLLLFGIVLGCTGRIVVFRNYNDIGLAFLLFLAPASLLTIAGTLGSTVEGPMLWFGFAVWVALLLYVADRTWHDNRNAFGAILALYTKTLLGILYVFAFLQFFAPTGSRRGARASSRRSGLILLLTLTPLIWALVRERHGYFSPPTVPGLNRPKP